MLSRGVLCSNVGPLGEDEDVNSVSAKATTGATNLDPAAAEESRPAPVVKVFVCSDTHCNHHLQTITPHQRELISSCDLFVHCGDFTHFGSKGGLDFIRWITDEVPLPKERKLVIFGNHESTWSRANVLSSIKGTGGSNPNLANELDAVATLVRDQEILECCGLTVAAASWNGQCPGYIFKGNHDVGAKVDILVTHGPESAHCFVPNCRAVADFRQKYKPRIHCFGHIHEQYGVTDDGQTISVNCATTGRMRGIVLRVDKL